MQAPNSIGYDDYFFYDLWEVKARDGSLYGKSMTLQQISPNDNTPKANELSKTIPPYLEAIALKLPLKHDGHRMERIQSLAAQSMQRGFILECFRKLLSCDMFFHVLRKS